MPPLPRFRPLAAAVLLALPVAASAAAGIVMHRDPGCGCCETWAVRVGHRFGRAVRIVDDARRDTVQRRAGVPASLTSCHTALVDGLAFEGHVPLDDMRRVLAERPPGVRGLAVAGMPPGSPGMEIPGVAPRAYTVVAFGPAGERVFARHGNAP